MISFEFNRQNKTIKCNDAFKEALIELSYLMGYTKENVEKYKNIWRGLYKISGNIRFQFVSNEYSNDNITINNEETFIHVISILEFISPFKLNLLRNIPNVKYSVDDVNLNYVTIPDIYYDMFDTYKVLNGNVHQNDKDIINIDDKVFYNRSNLKYVKIRKSNISSLNNLFTKCDNLKVVLLEDPNFTNMIDKNVNKEIIDLETSVEDSEESPF